MAVLHGESPVLYVLGRFEMRAGDRLVIDRSWNRHNARALLKALAVAPGHTLSRDAVSAIIAPGLTRAGAANVLYKALHYIRTASNDAGIADIVLLSSQSVSLAPPVVVDADVFREAADRAIAAPSAEVCDAAIARYAGDLLPEDDDAAWASGPRDELRRQYLSILFASGRAHAAAGEGATAIARFEALAHADPANEAAQIALIEQYVAAGWRDRALRQYEQCREALAREHGIAPSPALERALESARTGGGVTSAPILPHGATGVPPGIVGRTSELSRVSAMIDDAIAGRGRMLLVGGDPGAGKTRLAEEAERRADAAGVRVLWGRCYETDGAPAYWPWLQVVRRFVLRAGAAAALDAMGDAAPVIAQVSPDAASLLDAPPAVPPLEPEGARFRLFDAIARTFVRAGADRPMLLIIDDIHTADAASLLLLRFLAREMHSSRLAVIATFREAEAAASENVASAIAAIAREEHAERCSLAGLGAADVRDFIVAATGVTPADAPLAALAERTDGNPLFLREMLRWLGAEGVGRLQSTDAPDVPVPATVRDVVMRRIAALSEPCADTLAVAAVIGREFRIELLRDAGIDDPMRALEEAEAARIIAPSVAGRGRFTFTHALIRESIYARLGAARRIELHGRVGEAIEASSHGNRSVHLPELAHHFYEAAPAGHAMRAVDYARRSAERSASLLAWESAVTEYHRALTALSFAPATEQAQRGDLLLALGDACKASGNAAAAREAFRDAASAARHQGDATMLARAALGFEGAGVTSGMVDRELEGLLGEALAALPGHDSSLRARLLGRLAMAVYWNGTTGDRDALSRHSMEMARRIGDPAALAYALKSRHFSLGGERPEERLGISTEIVRMAERAGDLELEFAGHSARLMDFLDLGDIRGVDAELVQLELRATALGQPIHHWARLVRQGMRAMLAGRFGEGERLANEALTVGLRSRDPNVMAYFGVQMITMRTAQGRMGELEAPTKDFIARFPAVGAWRAVLAHVYASTKRLDDARAVFDELAKDDFAALSRDWTWSGAVALSTLVAARLSDAPRAEILYHQLQPYAGRTVVVAAGVACWGAVSLYLGSLASTMGRRADAIRQLEAAIDLNAKIESRPWVAIAQAELARVLVSGGNDGERRSAGMLARSAIDEARQLGMRALEVRAQWVLAKAGQGEDR